MLGKGGFGEVSSQRRSQRARATRLSYLHRFVLLGVRLPGESHGQDVRLQEAGEEEDKEEERGVHGSEREADSGESQQQICRESTETEPAHSAAGFPARMLELSRFSVAPRRR